MQEKITPALKKMIEWSHENFHELPWRISRSPYSTLVSELMLQQTTVSTVLKRFDDFMKTFPTVVALAKASEEEVLIAWRGLGYYRRARSLHKAAIAIVKNFKGVIPQTVEELILIDGIGDYTANAIVGIGYNKKALAIDANLLRVLARFYNLEESPLLKKTLPKLFQEKKILTNMEELGPADLHEALMDLGREVCTAKKVLCDQCPVGKSCLSYGKDFSEKKNDKSEAVPMTLYRLLVRDGKKLFFYQKEKGEWLQDQWELPTFILDKKMLKQYEELPEIFKEKKVLLKMTSTITKYRITNIVIEVSKRELMATVLSKRVFLSLLNEDKPISSLTVKICKKLLS